MCVRVYPIHSHVWQYYVIKFIIYFVRFFAFRFYSQIAFLIAFNCSLAFFFFLFPFVLSECELPNILSTILHLNQIARLRSHKPRKSHNPDSRRVESARLIDWPTKTCKIYIYIYSMNWICSKQLTDVCIIRIIRLHTLAERVVPSPPIEIFHYWNNIPWDINNNVDCNEAFLLVSSPGSLARLNAPYNAQF